MCGVFDVLASKPFPVKLGDLAVEVARSDPEFFGTGFDDGPFFHQRAQTWDRWSPSPCAFPPDICSEATEPLCYCCCSRLPTVRQFDAKSSGFRRGYLEAPVL